MVVVKEEEEINENFEIEDYCKDSTMIKTNVKVRGSTNGISNKYSINSYYSIWKPHTKEVPIG